MSNVEALLKMASHGRQPWRYFADGWNVFDFLIILVCLLPLGGPFAAVLRLARALRLFRLVSALPRLQLLVGALLKSLSAMGYVSLLLALLFYIYAVAGIHLFGAHDPKNFGSLAAAVAVLEAAGFEVRLLHGRAGECGGIEEHRVFTQQVALRPAHLDQHAEKWFVDGLRGGDLDGSPTRTRHNDKPQVAQHRWTGKAVLSKRFRRRQRHS